MSLPETRPPQPAGYERAFVGHLERLVEREDRAALAELRRGLGRAPGEAAGMHRHIVPYIPPDAAPWDEAPYYLVASLFALHQGSLPHDEEGGRVTNLGASYGRLSDEVGRESVEKRFVALLNAEREELPNHLRQAISLLKSREIRVDWLQLLRDVRRWDHPERRVQRSWARAYWRAAPVEDGASRETTAETTEAES